MAGLMNEAGGHRIQRNSSTDKRGRVHSSTVTVSVSRSDLCRENGVNPASKRGPQDFELQWYSGKGAGGQHRNKKMNSARLKHIPTGIIVTAQCRKRPQSETQVYGEMTARLDALVEDHGSAVVNDVRRAQVGLGEGADKRRTYRFQEGVVTDHLTGKSMRIKDALRGKIDAIW